MKTCENCVYCTRENYCTHREGPYKTWSENHCNNFESKEKDNEIMNEELRKKYGNMTIDDMIEKMERQEVWIKALEQDGRNYRNELLENRARISDLERAYDRLYEENATFVKKNEALDKRATELVKSVEEKDEHIKDLEDRLAVANRNITSYHSEIKKTREKDAELVKSVEEKDEQIEKLKNELDEANAEIGELGGRITERHATNRDLAKNCVKLETELREKEDTIINKDMYIAHLEHEVIKKGDKINSLINENRDKEAKIASLTQELADKKNQIWRLNEDIAKYCEDTNPKIGTITARLTFKENQVKDLEKKLEEKDIKLATWERDFNGVCAKNFELERKLKELQKDNDQLRIGNLSNRSHVKNLEEQLRESEAKNYKLENEVRELNDRLEAGVILYDEKSKEFDQLCHERDNLTQQLEDKDDVIAELEEQLEHQKHIISNYERDIVRYSKSDEEKKYLENDISLSKAFYEIGEHVSLGFIDAIKAYGKKCEEESKPKLSYKCCPEIKKLIDDAGYMRDYMERILRGDKPYNLDISSLYPKKFDLNPNADCPAYAARMKAKYDSLIKVGFTEDQAMSLIPMWTDECGE